MRVSSGVRGLIIVLAAASVAWLAGPAAAAAPEPVPMPVPVPVPGRLLPVPAAPPGGSVSTVATDVTPLGVVVGTSTVTAYDAEGVQTVVFRPQRWAALPRVGWLRQGLRLPAGGSGWVAGVTDLGEAGGTVTGADGTSRAVRWSVTGTSSSDLGGPGSSVTAVGPSGVWGVFTPAAQSPTAGNAELVTRSGIRTPMSGTPDLDGGQSRRVITIGSASTAVVAVASDGDLGREASPVLWRAGATRVLPVIDSQFANVTYCASEVRPDGSLVYAGINPQPGSLIRLMARHVGGVPGQEVDLARAIPWEPMPSLLLCDRDATSDLLAADGGVAAVSADWDGDRAAFFAADNTRTVVPREPGEPSAEGVAVATGRRMVIRYQTREGPWGLAFWHDGVRTPLALPAGWTLDRVVELTDRGLLVADVRHQENWNVTRPAVWNLAGL
jgi:hypothetical protein